MEGASAQAPIASPRASDRNDHASRGDFSGQLTRANVQLAVRSGVLSEAEASRYWQARRRFRTLSDSNSDTTIEKRTQELEEAKARVLECMNTSASSLLERERGEKRKLEEEVRRLKQRLAGAGLQHAGE